VVADLDLQGAESVAEEFGGLAIRVDVRRASDIRALIARAGEANGPIDLFCSNAGIPGPGAGPEASDEDWRATWEANVLAPVWAARGLLPGMLARGGGDLVTT